MSAGDTQLAGNGMYMQAEKENWSVMQIRQHSAIRLVCVARLYGVGAKEVLQKWCSWLFEAFHGADTIEEVARCNSVLDLLVQQAKSLPQARGEQIFGFRDICQSA
jgi:hypothetical protein